MGHYVIQLKSTSASLQADSTTSAATSYAGNTALTTNANYCVMGSLFSPGKFSTDYYVYQSFLAFDTSSIPLTDHVTNVDLRMYGVGSYSINSGESGTVLEVYPSNWSTVGAGILQAVNGGSVGATSGTTMTSGAFNPRGTYTLLLVMATVWANSNPTLSISDTFGGLSWTQVSSADTTGHTVSAIFYATTSVNAAGTVTVTSSATIVGGVLQFDNQTGIATTAPVRQSAVALLSPGTASSLSTTLPAAPLSQSALISTLSLIGNSFAGFSGIGGNQSSYNNGTTATGGAGNAQQLVWGGLGLSGSPTTNISWGSGNSYSGTMVTLEIASGSPWNSTADLTSLHSAGKLLATYDTWAGGTNSWKYAASPGSTALFNDFTPNGSVFNNNIVAGGTTSLVVVSTKIRLADTGGDGAELTIPSYVAGNTNGTNTLLTIDTTPASTSHSSTAMMLGI